MLGGRLLALLKNYAGTNILAPVAAGVGTIQKSAYCTNDCSYTDNDCVKEDCSEYCISDNDCHIDDCHCDC